MAQRHLGENYRKIFWGQVYQDKETAAYGTVFNNDQFWRNINAVSSKGTHAEFNFIKEFKTKCRFKPWIQKGNVDIIINLSKSPCFQCKEDLEEFFEFLKNKLGVRVTFKLRIANLYHEGKWGSDAEICLDLALWLYHLNRNGIVDFFDVQPILVVKEICSPSREGSVNPEEWKMLLKEREKKKDKCTVKADSSDFPADQLITVAQNKDEKNISEKEWNMILKNRITIRKQKDKNITNLVKEINKILRTRTLSIPLTRMKMKMDTVVKQKFYKSQKTKASPSVCVAQLQINAVNPLNRHKVKVFTPIIVLDAKELDAKESDTEESDLDAEESDSDAEESDLDAEESDVKESDTKEDYDGQRGCCATIPGIIEKLYAKNNYTNRLSWRIESMTIALSVTHFPCFYCLEQIIKSKIHKDKLRLILRVANISHEHVEWLYDLDEAGLIVQLQAIKVVEELGKVNCPTLVSKKKWEKVKQQRENLDDEIKKQVERLKKACKKLREDIKCFEAGSIFVYD